MLWFFNIVLHFRVSLSWMVSTLSRFQKKVLYKCLTESYNALPFSAGSGGLAPQVNGLRGTVLRGTLFSVCFPEQNLSKLLHF